MLNFTLKILQGYCRPSGVPSEKFFLCEIVNIAAPFLMGEILSTQLQNILKTSSKILLTKKVKKPF